MKKFLLALFVLASSSVYANIQHDRFVYQDWLIMIGDIVVLPTSPHKPIKLLQSDHGAALACRITPAELLYDGVVTQEFLDIAAEEGIFLYCTNEGVQGLRQLP